MNNLRPRVAIIYLCYGMEKYLDEVVCGIENQTYPKEFLGVVMVSNGSPDNIANEIKAKVLPRSEKDFPRVILIDDKNTGFAGNNNQGMKIALDQKYDYIFLHNGDLKLEPNAIDELVKLAESDKKIGSVQALVKHWNEPDKVNVSGGVFHIAGYGYARDNWKKIDNQNYKNGEEITYASGAAVLYRSKALEEVGLLEEAFFMYHEDLELGLRLRIAGYKNVLCSLAFALHDYNFSRNINKFKWMELYKWIVVLSYWKFGTLLLIMPVLLAVELGSVFLSIKGGWFGSKMWSYRQMCLSKTWKIIFRIKQHVKDLRKVQDKDLMIFVSGVIKDQENQNLIIKWIANPILSIYVKFLRLVIIW